MFCSWESPLANCLAGAPGGDYLSRAIVNCRGAPTADLRSWVSPPADGSRSPERSHTGVAVRNRDRAGCRESAGQRHDLVQAGLQVGDQPRRIGDGVVVQVDADAAPVLVREK